MNKLDPVWNIFLTFLLIIYFIILASSLSAQTKFCKQEICVVEFNAYWNKDNSVSWLDSLVNCGVTRILITDKQMLADVQKKYKIQNVPTIIIFKEEEVERYQACLRFKIGVKLEDVQNLINIISD